MTSQSLDHPDARTSPEDSAPPETHRVASRRSSRLLGIDAARGLAILGMVVAHLATRNEPIDPSAPETWVGVADGRPSTLFAIVAGLSVALVTARAVAPSAGRRDHRRARASLVARGVLVGLFGLALVVLPTGVAVILPVYGLLFLVVATVATWPVPRIVVTAAALAALAPAAAWSLSAALAAVDTGPELPGRLAGVLLQFPPVSYAAYLLVGLAVGRCDLRSDRVRRLLLVGGAAVSTAAYSVGALLAPERAGATPGSAPAEVLFSPRAYSNSWIDLVGTSGVAMAVIGLCLIVADRASGALSPLAVVGAMPLTAYTIHLVLLAGAVVATPGPSLAPAAAAVTLGVTLLGTWLFARLWSRRHARGPLEAALASGVGAILSRTDRRRG